jgi:hypothetical protein
MLSIHMILNFNFCLFPPVTAKTCYGGSGLFGSHTQQLNSSSYKCPLWLLPPPVMFLSLNPISTWSVLCPTFWHALTCNLLFSNLGVKKTSKRQLEVRGTTTVLFRLDFPAPHMLNWKRITIKHSTFPGRSWTLKWVFLCISTIQHLMSSSAHHSFFVFCSYTRSQLCFNDWHVLFFFV